MAWAMDDPILKFDKFWVLWISCLDTPRTIKDVQRIWRYGGNALYQKGIRKPIWEEMADKGYIKRVSKIKKRGVSGLTLESNFTWLPEYLTAFGKEVDFENKNHIVYELLNSIKDKKALFRYIEDHRQSFFFIDRVKILFGNKENLKSNYEMAIFAPILVLLNMYIWETLQKRMGVDENVAFFVSSTFLFNMNPKLNFLDYFLEVTKDMKGAQIPSTIFDQKRIFGFWKGYSKKISENLFL
jgi:hypothetical protein